MEGTIDGLRVWRRVRGKAVEWTLELRPPIPVADLERADERRLATRLKGDPKARRTFPQSVASGDPSESGVVLWTRIGPEAYDAGTSLLLEVAEDGRFARGRRCYEVDAAEIGPEHDYTVKVDLDGTLEADRRYYYRFGYDDATSRTGRCRTLPAADSSPESVRFGVFTCQNYLNGYFGAHHHLAREDVEFLLDLGDSIYEVGDLADAQEKYAGHRLELEKGKGFVDGLEDYRGIYRIYRSNRFFQEALERHTRIHVWDDHEFVNDIYWEEDPESRTVVPRARRHPASHPRRSETAFMLGLIAGAIQAWSEYTPARFEFGSETGPLNERVKLYRRFQFGDLLALIRTDERLYKSRTQSHWSEYWIEHAPTEGLEQLLRQWLSRPEEDSRSMLGKTQREWFLEEVTKPGSTWTVWANEVLTLPIPLPSDHTHDAWDGYRNERRRIMDAVANARRSGDVKNFVTLTGDMHSHLAGYQCQRYPVRDLIRRPKTENRVGVELMTPAVTSGNISEEIAEELVERFMKKEGPVGDAMRPALASVIGCLLTIVVERLRYIESFDSRKWGYSVVEFTPDYCTHRTYSVDKRTNAEDAERRLFKEFRVPNGEIEIEEVA